MALSDTSKTSIAFKKSISKDFRYASNEWYEETDGGGFNSHSNDIWQEAIPSTPPGTTTTVVQAWITGGDGPFKLTQDVSVPNSRGWYADTSGTRQRGWIPPKYGQAYTVKLYQDNGSGTAIGSQVFTTDAMDWFFDYDTGYLAIQDTHSYTTPFWIQAYRYVGNKQGVQSLAAGTNANLVGDVKLAAGANVSLAQSGTTITIAASASGSAGASELQHSWVANGPFIVDTFVDGGYVAPTAGTIAAITLYRTTPGTGGTTTIDVNKNGTTMYSTQGNRPQITVNTAGSKVTATLPDVTVFAAGDVLTVDTDAVETGTPQHYKLTMKATT